MYVDANVHICLVTGYAVVSEVMVAPYRSGSVEVIQRVRSFFANRRTTSARRYHHGYHEHMAMTLRLTDVEHAALRSAAEREGRSQHEVIRSALEEYLDRHSRQALLDRVLDRELPRYAEALRRLGE